jgi:hypothetical protein
MRASNARQHDPFLTFFDDFLELRPAFSSRQGLRSGRVDAVVCFFNNEPIVLRAENFSIREWDVKDFSDMASASFISSKGIIAARRDVIGSFVKATRLAVDRIVEMF